MVLQIENITNQDHNKNLSEDLVEFSNIEKQELSNIKSEIINNNLSSLEELSEDIVNKKEKLHIQVEL